MQLTMPSSLLWRCLSSVENISFHGNLNSNKPIDLKFSLDISCGVVTEERDLKKNYCELQIYVTYNFFANKFVFTGLTDIHTLAIQHMQ